MLFVEGHGGRTTRRGFMEGAAAAGTLLLLGPARDAFADIPRPDEFPDGIELFRSTYENWAQELHLENLWTAAPKTPDDVVRVANWAATRGFRVRARGMMHGWSPFLVTAKAREQKLVLLDTTQHLDRVELADATTIRAQAGATMDTILGFAQDHGLGVVAAPAPGDITIGGALAINAHGTAIPARGEERRPGQTYGSLSNLVTSLTAVVWDRRRHRFALRRFDRDDPAIKPLLTHLGRTFVTEVDLRMAENVNLRCQSFMDIDVTELFAAPGTKAERSFDALLTEAGRAEAILFPYTTKPWMKTWTVAPTRPASSREVSAPYNYVFSDNIPEPVAAQLQKLFVSSPSSAQLAGQGEYLASVAGLQATQTADIWGPSRNLLHYIKPTTLRASANGYAVHVRRADVQRAVSDFHAFYQHTMDAYEARGMYPANTAVEIRVTGLDDPAHVGINGAKAPALSALRARRDRPEWDTVVWFDILTVYGTPGSMPFYRDIERLTFDTFSAYGMVRPEWSKGWGYDGKVAWNDKQILEVAIPRSHRIARAATDDWDWALRTLDRYDPHRVFTSELHDRFRPRRAKRKTTRK